METKNKKQNAIKLEFPYDSLVKISGRDMDEYTFKVREDAPDFIGIVQNPDHWNDLQAEETKEGELFVLFVLCCGYEWLDKNYAHVMRGKYDDTVLNLVAYPPDDDKPVKSKGPNCPYRWFRKGEGKWEIRALHGPCYQCGSPWCHFNRRREEKTNIVKLVEKTGDLLTNREKRWRCYRIAGSQICRVLGDHSRKRLGWCYTNYVRTTFPKLPDEEYTGFKYGANMRPYSGDSSDSDELYTK